MISFYTKFTTKEEDRDALLAILTEAAAGMEEIEECHLYIVNKDFSDAAVIWVTELWTTAEAHAASLKIDDAKELIAKAMPLMASRPEQIKLIPVSGKGM